MKMLGEITPVIITFNEAPNICRTLDMLGWAKDIVILDSFSTDDTVKLIQKYSQVRLFQRQFDTHVKQWDFAIHKTSIKTKWVLALDADYVLTEAFVEELKHKNLNSGIEAYSTNFNYCVWGQRLSATLYTPVTVLYKREHAYYAWDGHTQRIQIDGDVGTFKSVILHDDRKSLFRWIQKQYKYSSDEANWLATKKFRDLRGIPDKLRKLIFIVPVITFFYCMFIKRGIFDGKAGLFYAIQRTVAEGIISLCLLEILAAKKEIKNSY